MAATRCTLTVQQAYLEQEGFHDVQIRCKWRAHPPPRLLMLVQQEIFLLKAISLFKCCLKPQSYHRNLQSPQDPTSLLKMTVLYLSTVLTCSCTSGAS